MGTLRVSIVLAEGAACAARGDLLALAFRALAEVDQLRRVVSGRHGGTVYRDGIAGIRRWRMHC